MFSSRDDGDMIEAAARALDPDAYLGWSRGPAQAPAPRAAPRAPAGGPPPRWGVLGGRGARPTATGHVSAASRRALLAEASEHGRRVGALDDTAGPAVSGALGRLLRVMAAEVGDVAQSGDGLAETDAALAGDRVRVARRIGAWAEMQGERGPAGAAVVVGLKAVALRIARGPARAAQGADAPG